jgi:hypothetical protein
MVALPNNPDGVFLQGATNEREPFGLQEILSVLAGDSWYHSPCHIRSRKR